MNEFLTSPLGILGLWLVVINLFTFLTFGLDKGLSKRAGARRIPERTLFTLAFIGGSVGALLGMRIWHHKTLHRTFKFGIPLILLAQIVIAAGVSLYWTTIR